LDLGWRVISWKNNISEYINTFISIKDRSEKTDITRINLYNNFIDSFEWIETKFPNLEYIDIREIPHKLLKPLLKLKKLNSIRISNQSANKYWIKINPIKNILNRNLPRVKPLYQFIKNYK
jgi:hypothetical protein